MKKKSQNLHTVYEEMEESASLACNLAILDSLTDDSIQEIIESYNVFCSATESLLNGSGNLSAGPEFVSHVHCLCKHGLDSLIRDQFLRSLEVYNRLLFPSPYLKNNFGHVLIPKESNIFLFFPLMPTLNFDFSPLKNTQVLVLLDLERL